MQATLGKRRGAAWLLSGVALWILASGALAACRAWVPESRVEVRNDNAAWTADDLTALRDAMDELSPGGRVSGFAQALRQSVTAEEMDGSASVDALYVDGDMRLLFSLSMVSGHMPALSDAEGCALSEKTARTLFGSVNIIGRTVTMNDTELIIRGVFTPPDGPTVFLSDPGRQLFFAPLAAAPEGTGMTALSALPHPGDGETGTEAVKAAMQQAGLSTSGTITDHGDTRAVLAIAAASPALLMLAIACAVSLSRALTLLRRYGELRRKLRENRLTPTARYVSLLVWLLAGLSLLSALVALAIRLLPEMPSVPPGYLPTAWSDFSFWSDLLDDALQNAAAAKLTVALRPDMIRDTLTMWVVALSALSLLCVFRGIRQTRRDNESASLAAGLLFGLSALCAVPCGIWLCGRAGWPASATLSTLVLPVLPIYIDLLVMKGVLYVEPNRSKTLVNPAARRSAGRSLATLGTGHGRGRHGAAVPGKNRFPASRV